MVISEPAGSEGKQPAGNGESGDGDVAESERPPRARLLPALTLPRFPCTPIPAAHTAYPKIGILPPCAARTPPCVLRYINAQTPDRMHGPNTHTILTTHTPQQST